MREARLLARKARVRSKKGIFCVTGRGGCLFDSGSYPPRAAPSARRLAG
ncbi:hypothetical protein B8V81_0428 [Paenibacillus pasadenensis]|uniref:Uncharacterized protein n=1 Tax=Paenibacillus pasadenensis TaxID=217090 RepID=A0A2N5ND66_9BACL|nr:hypothetical protein B8V81_0428 [Paenibacillus pasadenensis]